MKCPPLPGAALASVLILLPATSAQGGADPARVVSLGAPARALHLDAATGELTRLAPGASPALGADTPATSFANTTSAGAFAIPAVGDEWIDWGVKAGGVTGVVCTLEVAYGTNALDPGIGGPGAALDVAVYQGTLGTCGVGDVAVEVFRTSLTGLPGSLDGSAVSYTLEIDLSKTPFLLTDGPLGWGYVGVDGLTGPLLITVGVDSTSTVDGYDVYAPAPAPTGVCQGTSTFFLPNVASFYLRLDEDDGSEPGSQVVRVGSGSNLGVLSLAPTAPKIGQDWLPEITTDAVSGPAVEFLAFCNAPDPGTFLPGLGEALISIAAPAPFLTLTQAPGTGPFAVSIPFSCNIIGTPIFTQGGQVGLTIGLTNAIDIVIGV